MGHNFLPEIFSPAYCDRMPAHVMASDPQALITVQRFCSKILLFHLKTLSPLISDLDQIDLMGNKSLFGDPGLMLARLSLGYRGW